VTVLNPHIERDQAAAYGIESRQSWSWRARRNYGIRFLGLRGG